MLYVDISEFIARPWRTGVQRVVRKLLAEWPSKVPGRAILFDEELAAFILVSASDLEFAIEQDRNPYLSLSRENLALTGHRRSQGQGALHFEPSDSILVPEVFYASGRARALWTLYERQIDIRYIVYDFIPWLTPDAVAAYRGHHLNRYLLSILQVPSRCHISGKVLHEFTRRIARCPCPQDIVVPLGADGLLTQGEASSNDIGSRLLCVGAFDGRKGQERVLQAFLQSDVSKRLELVFAGRIPTEISPTLAPVLECRHPRVTIARDPPDAELARLMATSRCTVFVSESEGFGLPAVESLHGGVPVIVHAGLPSTEDLPDLGQIRLTSRTIDELVAAFERVGDDVEARRLRGDAAALSLPTWKTYAQRVAEWASTPLPR